MTSPVETPAKTPLAAKLRDRILCDGPISVSEFMTACLHDPEHGYYRTARAIGRDGDFITAPEISQIFGELIGLWAAVVWQQMGSPSEVHLVELGPGRGTMMRDMLRVSRVVPGFAAALRVHLVEVSPHLAAVQHATLAEHAGRITWHRGVDEVPWDRSIVIANEYLDTFPVDLWRFDRGAAEASGLPLADLHASLDFWLRRHVGLDGGGRLEFTWARAKNIDGHWFRRHFIGPLLRRLGENALSGDIIEVRNVHDTGYAKEFSRIASSVSAALIIDYGHVTSSIGETLQAVRHHRPEHPLASPGEADLTAQVDFAEVISLVDHSEIVEPRPLFDGPIPQAEFLGRLGIVERASRLMVANPAKAAAIEADIARLMAPNGMGIRFKVLGVRSPQMPPLPGFVGVG